MSDEDIRARLASTDAHILTIEKKLDEIRVELQEAYAITATAATRRTKSSICA